MVYGDFTDNVEEWEDCNPQGQYAIMKYAGELLVQETLTIRIRSYYHSS